MLSMPRGTDPLIVQKAARELAHQELAGHKWMMVLHDHQANPHVHLSVRAESRSGQRLNPRKADLQRWRETFTEKLRGSRVRSQSVGVLKAGIEGRLKRGFGAMQAQAPVSARSSTDSAWKELESILAMSA